MNLCVSYRFTRVIITLWIAALLVAQNSLRASADTIFLPVVQNAATTAINTADANTTTVIVQLDPDTDPALVSTDHQASIVSSIPTLSLYRLQGTTPQMLDDLIHDGRILSAEPDYSFRAFEAHHRSFNATGSDFEYLQRYFGFGSGDDEANDSNYSVDPKVKKNKKGNATKGKPKHEAQVLVIERWQLVESSWQDWGMRAIKMAQAHRRTVGAGIKVAILDTGVDLDHPALVDHLLPGYDFVENDPWPDDAPNGVDDDEDGKVDEGAGHGTHVTGIIARVAPKAQLIPVRVLNSDGGGALFDIVQGIVFAVEQGAQVINFSLSADEDSPIFAAAIDYALQHNVVVVAAADGAADYLEYPAAYANVLAVGAMQKDRRVTDFSAPYAELVDVFAPGELIYSTYYDGRFAWWSGTSMAAPFVSGEAALILARSPCNTHCIFNKIVKDVDRLRQKLKTSGHIDLDKASK